MFQLHALGAEPGQVGVDQERVRRVERLLQAPAPLLAWLQDHLDWPQGTRLVDLRPSRIWPGKKDSLTFELSLQILRDGRATPYLIQGQAGTADPVKAEHRAPRFGAGEYLLGVRIASAPLGVSLWSPDYDAHLPAARRILRGESTAEAGGAVGEESAADRAALAGDRPCHRIVAYRAAKRCTFAEVHPGDGRIVAYYKVFRRMPAILLDHYPGAFADALERRSGGNVRIPLAQRICVEERMLVSEPVTFDEGHPPDAASRITRAADLLAALHDVSVDFMDKLPVHDASKELETVHRWLGCCQRFGHMPGERASQVWAGIGSLAVAASGAPTRIAHRDFYERQLQHDGEYVYLTDLDTLALAHVEVDVATYLAHEFLDELTSGGTVDSGKQKGMALVARYLSEGGRIDRDRLRFYLGCALARLGCIHVLRGVDPEIIENLWGVGESQINGSWEIGHG